MLGSFGRYPYRPEIIRRSLMLMGEASRAITTSPSPGAPTSGTSTNFITSAGLPNASIWIAFMTVLPVMYHMVYNRGRLSSKQFQDLVKRGTNARRVRRIFGQHHQPGIDRHDGVRGGVGIEAIGELPAIGAQPVSQQFLQLPVEAFDPLADFLLLGRAVGRCIDGKASALALDAGTERDKAGQPAMNRLARRRAIVDDAFGLGDDAGVIALQNLEEQGILVAEGGIKARLGEPGRGGDVVERRALESVLPEHVAREVQRLVGIETARSCHLPYVRDAGEIANRAGLARFRRRYRRHGLPAKQDPLIEPADRHQH